MRKPLLLVLIAATATLAACEEEPLPVPIAPDDAATITLSSSGPAMTNGKVIRTRYTCDGPNFSPKINWTGVPEDAASLVLVLDDPDAPDGTYLHWLIYNLPPDVNGFEEGAGNPFKSTPQGGQQGTNSSSRLGYSGPCPPKDELHRYQYHLYALDSELILKDLAERNELFTAMQDSSILGYGRYESAYLRRSLNDENVVFDLTPVPTP